MISKNSLIPITKAQVFFDGTFSDPRLSHPEGLAFDKEGNLWCGGERGEIYKIDHTGKTIELIGNTGGFSLGMAFDSNNNLYVCDNKHQCVFKLNTITGEITKFADGNGELRVPNFPVVDEKYSCLYVSDSYGAGEEGPGIWRFELETGKGDLWYKKPLNFANGLAISLDRSALYVAETFSERVSVIPILPHGEAGEKEVFVDSLNALPDGLALDVNGNLYVSCYEPSQVLKINDNKEVETLIHDVTAHTLCHPTNCAFWGEDMYTTNLGRWHITKFPVGVKGAPLIME
jgi:gluconolactonase